MNNGKLYIVPTPIGNLEDITLRAINVLKSVDLILAEDTRTSSKLLKHYDITTPTQSFHQYNEHHKTATIISWLKQGKNIAQISDAGTPGISDPGFLLIRNCIEHNIFFECLLGATAFVPALLQSGFANHEFLFIGFLPQKKGRQTKLQELANETRTIILYESPHKIEKTIAQIALYFGEERNVSISREISKLYEETLRGSAKELFEKIKEKPLKGEIVVCIEGNKSTKRNEE